MGRTNPKDSKESKRSKNIFVKSPLSDPPHLRKKYQHIDRGLHFYFRTMKLKMQSRFVELIDHSGIPRVFLHGSPHLDNYSRSERGVAMVDFDRSRIGPYAWDLVRLLTSVRCRLKVRKTLQESAISGYLLVGFKKGFCRPHKNFKEMNVLAAKESLSKAFPTRQYLQRNKRWAQRMRLHPLRISDEDMLAVLHSYLQSRNEHSLLNDYAVDSAGWATGTMGRQRYLIVLSPRKRNADLIFLEVKRVREDPDNQWYFNPFDHHGKRMIEAANLYAPGWEIRQGYASHNGFQYWGHQIPNQNIKIKRPLKLFEQKDFLFSVGTQLGRAHRVSICDASPKELLQHLSQHYDAIVDAAEIMAQEIEFAFQIYLKRLTQIG